MDDKPTKILLVEDNPGDVRLIREMLKESRTGRFEMEGVERLDQGLKCLSQEAFDVVLLDLNLPDSRGLDTFVKAHAQAPEVPIVVLSGLEDEALAIESVQKGAQDYLVKGKVNASPLIRSVRYAIERMQTEKALRESEEKYRGLYDSINDGFVKEDLEGHILECNQAYLEMLGYTMEEIKKLRYQDFTPPKWHRVEGDVAQNQIMKRGYSDEYEKEYIRKDGTVFPVSVKAWLIKDKPGRPVGIWEIVRDITERKKAEEQILHLSRFPSENPSPILRIGSDGSILYMNKAADSVLKGAGLSKNEVLNILPDNLDELVTTTLKTKKTVRDLEIIVGNRVYSYTVAPVAKSRYVNLYAVDVTERKKAEEALRGSEKRSRTLVESITDGVIMIDQNLEVKVMNPSALSIIGSGGSDSHPDAEGLQKILGTDFRELKKRFIGGEELLVKEEVGIRAGTYKTIISPIKGAGKSFAGLVISLHDVTEDKRLETLKSEFVSIVSHELRTPLTSIKSAVDLISSGKTGEINKDQANFLSMASRNVDRLARIINDFLDISKMEADRMELHVEKVNLREVIDATVSTFALNAQKKSVGLTSEVSLDLPDLVADPDRLAQILTNLVSNAVKFTPEGGKISVVASPVSKSASPIPEILSLPHEHFVKVEVKDTGVGIPADEVEQVFDKFHQVEKSLTRKEPGTGLGLPICKRLVEAHKGRIWATSEVDQGSRFTFVLPVLKGMEIFDHRLDSLISRAKSITSCLSLALVKVKESEGIKTGLGSSKRAIFEQVVEIAKKSACKSTDYVQPDEESGRVFIILEQTSREGALAVCKRLKDNLSDYDFSVERRVAELEFCLGLATYPDDGSSARELREIAERTELVPSLRVRQKTILVIDDDENFVHALSRKLTRHKYKIVESFSGFDGIEKARQLQPDLIILDLLMPEMDGYEVASKLKKVEETKDIPVLVLSGGENINISMVMALGAEDFITKPFSDAIFLSTIERLAKRREVNHAYDTVGGR